MPEDARVTLLGRPGCHLCDEAREVVRAVAGQAGAGWTERSVDEDETLRREYSDLVPVVLVDGAVHAYWRVDAGRLRAALEGPGTGAGTGSSWLRRWRRTP